MGPVGYISAGLTMLAGVINTLQLRGQAVRFILAIIVVATGVMSMLAFDTSSGQRNEARGVVQGADSTIAKLTESVASLTQQLQYLSSQMSNLSQEKQEEVNASIATANSALTEARTLQPRIDRVLPRLTGETVRVQDSVEVTKPAGPAGPTGGKRGGGR